MKPDCSTEEVVKKLQAPFPSEDIEWRVSHAGTKNKKKWAMVLAYVTNRAIQNRLDQVFGPAGWKNSYCDFKNGILCTISCFIDGEWVDKSDGAEQTDIESLKGGLSSAMKRAAVQWGIGRYLYKLEAMFVEVFDDKRKGAIQIKDKKNNVHGYWFPPSLPEWALPVEERVGKSPGKEQSFNSSSKQEPVQSNKFNQKSNEKEPVFNRETAVKAIKEYLTNTGLSNQPQWILPLFKRINPNMKQNSFNEVMETASEEEFEKYYSVLRPVNDLTVISRHYNISLDDVLNYVQLLNPTIKIESLFDCYNHVTKSQIKEILQFVKEDLENGNIKQIA